MNSKKYIKKVQSENNLPVTGIVDLDTLNVFAPTKYTKEQFEVILKVKSEEELREELYELFYINLKRITIVSTVGFAVALIILIASIIYCIV